MKLDEYVKQTLVDISKGVSEAKTESLVGIAPGYVDGEKVFAAQMISFEIIVTTEKEAGGGIRVLSLGDLEVGGKIQHVNRISFEVPVFFQAPPISNRSK